jgi:prepilin-type processing-associated H-X9-DG protein
MARFRIPLDVISCPTRRLPLAYPWPSFVGWNLVNAAGHPTVVARSDYAANGGSRYTSPCWPQWPTWSMTVNCEGGPPSLDDGGVGGTPAQVAAAKQEFANVAAAANGVIFLGSLIKMRDITDGTNVTYLLGERYVGSDWYTTGEDGGDTNGALIGDNMNISRWTANASGEYFSNDSILPPMQDMPGYQYYLGFGSAHPTSLNMAMCDGSVHAINYSISPTIHCYLGNRKDGQAIDAKSF